MARNARVAAATAGALIVALAAIGGMMWWLVNADAGRPFSAVDVVVPDGSSMAQIATQLAQQGVIRAAAPLQWYFRLHGGGDQIQAAEYAFAPHETVAQVATVLIAGGKPPALWVTIPEGFTNAQIGARLASSGLVSAEAFAREAKTRSIQIDGVPSNGLEGFLFPDTYQIPRHAGVDGVIDQMTQQFFRELPPDHVAAARRLHLSVPQIVTVASMIELEAKAEVDRPLIASVIYNRLRIGMPLEIDATIEYALPHHKTALSFADLDIDSPYNTYRHTGLPPTPISNPGKASLLAAFHPATTPYLYYVYRGGGRHEFARTLQEQQLNERRFLR